MESRGNTIFKWEYAIALGGTAALALAKLAGGIGWSWVWVLSPLWIMGGLGLAVVLASAALCRFGAAPIVAGPPLKRLRRRRRPVAARRRLAANQR